MGKLKVMECFGGIGACSKALERLGIDYEIADYVEIDKYAVKSFNAIHGTSFEPQDITEWDKDIEADLIMHGSPCQDFSVAGKGAGGDKDSGTRSSLMYETLRIVEKIKPKYVIWENVKNLLSKKHRHNFDAYQSAMQQLGYNSYFQVLNAKDYGIPQNRERVFTVSIRNDGEFDSYFEFPKPFPLEKKLKDVLEKEVDEKYYLTDKAITGYLRHSSRHEKRGNGFKFEPTNGDTVAHTASTKAGGRPTDNFIREATPLQKEVCDKAIEKGLVEPNDAIEYTYSNARLKEIEQGHIKKQNKADNQVMSTLKTNPQQIGVCVSIKTATKQGYDLAKDGDGIDLAYPKSTTRRGRVGHGVSKTIPTSDSQGCLDGMRIRKLTPKECWRLMGFDDASFERAEKVNSSTQLYKQAGNSIVVDVLVAILKNLLEAEING